MAKTKQQKEKTVTDLIAKLQKSKAIVTIFSYEDEVTPAKTVQNFAKDHEAMLAVGGIVEGQYFDRTKILALSKLPTKLELLAKVVGSISSPISGLVNVFAGNLRNLVYILNAVKQKNS